jgi:hypothetical protein
LDADTSNEWANMTPSVRGNRDVYVLAEYHTPLAGLVDRLAWNAVTASRSKGHRDARVCHLVDFILGDPIGASI